MILQIEKIYLIYLKTVVKPEVQHNKQALQGEWSYQLGVGHEALENNRYQIILTLKAEYTQAGQVLAKLMIQQAGNVVVRDYTPQQLFYLLNIEAPRYLFPQLRQRVMSITSHMGVKCFELPFLDFYQAKQRPIPVEDDNPPGYTVREEEVDGETKVILSESKGEPVTMPLIPELALGMTLAKMTKDTVNAGISWWKGEKKEKKAAIFIPREEQEAARASLTKLQEEVRKLRQLSDLEKWCQHSLEDLDEKLQKAAKKEALSNKHIEKLQADLAAIRDDYEITDNLAKTL